MESQTRPITLKLLLACLIFLGLGGIGGGVAFLIDPSGETMQLPPNLLDGLPIRDFFLPGLFLLVVMGILPLIIAYGLGRRLWWSWAASLGQGVVLILWISLQIVLWGAPAAIQIFYLALGIAILGLSLLPATKNHLKR